MFPRERNREAGLNLPPDTGHEYCLCDQEEYHLDSLCLWKPHRGHQPDRWLLLPHWEHGRYDHIRIQPGWGQFRYVAVGAQGDVLHGWTRSSWHHGI